MAIARKPNGKPARDKDDAAAKFIRGAAPPDALAPATKRKPAMIRFDAELLARVDQAAKRRGISRSGWIAYTVSKALDIED